MATKRTHHDSFVIAKLRVKQAIRKCKIGKEVYAALDQKVRCLLAEAEARALANKRKTLLPQDL